MRHRVASKSFNRDTKARKGLFKGLIRALIEQGSIETTVDKAKVIKQIADRLIGKAAVDSVSSRRVVHQFFGTRDAVNTIFDRVMPAAEGRVSGFTRIEKLSNRRGDNTLMVKISLVGLPAQAGTLRNLSPKTEVKVKPVKKSSSSKAAKTVTKKAPAKKVNKK